MLGSIKQGKLGVKLALRRLLLNGISAIWGLNTGLNLNLIEWLSVFYLFCGSFGHFIWLNFIPLGIIFIIALCMKSLSCSAFDILLIQYLLWSHLLAAEEEINVERFDNFCGYIIFWQDFLSFYYYILIRF
jgi:hypothetical protein